MILITVTDVVESEQSRGRFSITVKLSGGVHEEVRTFTVFRFFLRQQPFCGTIPAVGEFFGAVEFDALTFAEECSNAAIKAVSLLAYGDNTAKKLAEKLRQKGFSRDAADAAVAFCVEKRYIREDAQLKRLMENLCEKKKYGLRRIRQEIYQKGFSEDVVKAVFRDVVDTLDFEAALDDRVRKLGQDAFSTPEKKQKSIAALVRYGFTYEEIREALRRM